MLAVVFVSFLWHVTRSMGNITTNGIYRGPPVVIISCIIPTNTSSRGAAVTIRGNYKAISIYRGRSMATIIHIIITIINIRGPEALDFTNHTIFTKNSSIHRVASPIVATICDKNNKNRKNGLKMTPRGSCWLFFLFRARKMLLIRTIQRPRSRFRVLFYYSFILIYRYRR